MANDAELELDVSGLKTEVKIGDAIAGQLESGEHKKEQQEDQVEKPETPSKAGYVQSAAAQTLSPSGPEECEQIPGAAVVTENNGSLHEAAKSETPSAVTITLASHSKTEGEALHKPPSDVQVPLQEALKSSDDDLQNTEEVEGLKNEKGEPRRLPLEAEHVDHGSAEGSDKSTKMEHEKECNAELSENSDHTQVQGWHGTEEESNEKFNSKVSGVEDKVHEPSEATKSDKEVVVEVEETKDVLYAEENRIQNSGTYNKDHNGEDLSDDKSSPQTTTENEEAESKSVKKDQSIVNANEISSRSCEESKIDQNDENRSEHQLELKDEMGTEQQEFGNSLALEATEVLQLSEITEAMEVLQPSKITEELETLSSQNPEISIKATVPTGKHEENMEGSDCEGTLCSAAEFPEAVGANGNNEYVKKEIDKTVQDTTLPLEERASRENVLEEDQKDSVVSESPKEHDTQIQTENDLNVDIDDKVEKQNQLCDMSGKMIPEDKKTVDISSSAEIVEENPQKSADVFTISDKQVDSGLGYQGSRSADESIIPAHPTVLHRQDNDTPMAGDKSEEVQKKELVDDQHFRTEHQEDANTEDNFEGTSLESCRSIGNHAESTIPEEGLETENFLGKQDKGLKEDETASGKAMEISYQTIRSSGVTIEIPREITPGEEAEVSGAQSSSNSGELYVEGNGAELGFKLETDQQTKLTENVDVKIDKTEENTELPLKKESVEEINVIHEIHSGSQESQMVAQQNHHNLDAIEVAGVITSSDASAKEIKVSDSSTYNEKIEDTLNAEESLKNANEERNDDKVQNGDTEELDGENKLLEDAVVESDQDSQLPDRIVTRTEGMNTNTSNSDHVSDMNKEDSEMTREAALVVNRASESSLNDSKEMKLEGDTISEQKNQDDTEGQVKGDDADKKTGIDTEVLKDKKLESKSEMIHESISGHEEAKRNLSQNEEKDTAQIEHESSNEELRDLPVVQALFVQTLDLVEPKQEIPFILVHEDQIQEDTGTERHLVAEDPQEEILEDNQRIKADTIACDIVSGKKIAVVEPANGNEQNEVADAPSTIEFENKEKEEPEEVRPKAKDEMKENSGMPNHESSFAQTEEHAAEERNLQNNFEMGKTLVVVEPAKGNEHNEVADAPSILEFENKEKEEPEEVTPKAKDEMKENSDMLNHGSSLAQAEEHTGEERKPQNNIEMEKYLTIDKQETDGDVRNTTEFTPQNEYGAEQLTCRDDIVKIIPENDSKVNNCEEAATSRREKKMNSDRSKAEASQIEKEEGGMSESSEKINSMIPEKMELADTKIPDNGDTEIKLEELTLPDEVANSNLQDEEQKDSGNGRDLPNTVVLEGENQNILQKEPDVEILDSTKMMPEAIKETKGEEANNMLENPTDKKAEKQDEEVRCDLKGAEGRDTTNPIYITETEVSIKEVNNDHGSTKQNFDQITTSIIAGSVELKHEKTDKILDVSAATSEATEKIEPEQVDIKCEQDSALIMQEPNLKNEANMAIYSEDAAEHVTEPLALLSNNASEEIKNGSSLIGTDPDNSLKTSLTIGALKGPVQKEDGEKVTIVVGINETVYLNKDGKENGEAVVSATQTMIEETSQVMQEKAVDQEKEVGQCDISRELQQQMSDDDLPASQFLMNRILQDDFLGEVDSLKPEDRIHDEKHNIEHTNVDVPKEDDFKFENQVGVENIIEKDKRGDISQSETKLNILGDEKGHDGNGLLRNDIEDDRREEPKEKSDPLNEHIVDADDTDGEEFSFTEKAFVQDDIKDKVNLTVVQMSNSETKVDAKEKSPEDLLPDKNFDEENKKENQQDDIHLNQSLDDASTTNIKNEVRLKETGKSSNESKEIQPGTQMVEKATADEEESLIKCEQSLPALQNQADSTLACQTENMVDVNEIKVSHPVSTEQLHELEERSLAATENLHHDETPKNNMGVSLATSPSEKEVVPRVGVENPVDTNQLQSNIGVAEKVKADDKPSPTIESFDSEDIESLSHGENGQDREFQEAEGLGYVVVKDQKHDILENGTEKNKVEDTQWKTPTNAEPDSAEVKQALADDSRDSVPDVVSVKEMIQIAETKLEDTPTAKENLALIAKENKSGVRDDQGGHESVKERSQVAEISLENELEANENDTSKSNEKKDDVVKNENHGVESVKEMTQVAETNFENKDEVQEKLPFIEKENRKGGNNDNNAENATGEPRFEASSSLIEIREAEPIPQHKKHTILSGVRSKVKHSITSVKKAITCSSTMTPE